jgi:hypothetical protein
MSGNVVMIVPRDGPGSKAFEAVAVELRKSFYAKAKIVYAKTTAAQGAIKTTYTYHNGKFDWTSALNLSRVLTISHGSLDGPIFGQDSDQYGMIGLQPWGIGDYSGRLSPEGEAFWQTVGGHMPSTGKIFLLGCNMGATSFARNVSKVAGAKHVYASLSSFGAGDTRVVIPAIRKIEGKG